MDNPQAFPGAFCVGPNDDLYPPTPGMTLRDWFAGQALAAVMASPENWRAAIAKDGLGSTFSAEMSRAAFGIADAMLSARQPKDPSNV